MSTEQVERTPSIVQQFVRDTIRANEMADDMEELADHGKIQVNVRLLAFYGFHLEHLAKHLGLTRAELTSELLRAAIFDAWHEAGLPGNVMKDPELSPQLEAYLEAHIQ